jgi:hypothetical protein
MDQYWRHADAGSEAISAGSWAYHGDHSLTDRPTRGMGQGSEANGLTDAGKSGAIQFAVTKFLVTGSQVP